MPKRLALIIAIAFCFLGIVSAHTPVNAKDKWTSVRSKNFLLVGNANEKDLRRVGARLEQFREVFSHLFTNLKISSPVPTTVIVFKNDESYRPFKPNANTAGYFQPGPDVNYITLEISSDVNNEQDPFAIIFHEYTHLLIRNTSGNVPTWFNEGLAEYYSTFSITDDQKVVMGRPIANHVYRLRENKMLPLRMLFQVDQKSAYYNERDKQSIFYAESWALVHYLILGKDGERMSQLSKFVDLISANVSMEQAFQQAFAMTFEAMEKELRAYIQRDRYPILNGHFENKLGYDSAMESAPITEAEAQAYLGDLLLKSNRADAEVYLQKALELDPDSAMANASLGLLRVRQGKHDEARKRLERAVAKSSQNYLIHYYYAYALSREGAGDMDSVMGMAPETAEIVRRELKRAIELRPDYLESYGLLAFVNLVTGTELDESMEMLKQRLTGAPHRTDLMFMLAQLYLRKEDFKAARQLIDKVIAEGSDDLRQRAQGMLSQLVAIEQQVERNRKDREEWESRHGKTGGSLGAGGETIEHPFDPAASLRESLRSPATGETQEQGMLTRIDCDAKGITFVVKVADRLLRLNTDTFEHANIVSFSDDAGNQITCGIRKTQNSVVVDFVPANNVRARVDGVLKSLEFVPSDFKLKP
ncbi:MAG TPA: FimV/HubP family polar landmark protein [Pyrinomonadaceae bacterium]|jgi:FimV-like protein|nr:FimV/HubP family polar landmark protein [Pyrinomonadaceae bacterium]